MLTFIWMSKLCVLVAQVLFVSLRLWLTTIGSGDFSTYLRSHLNSTAVAAIGDVNDLPAQNSVPMNVGALPLFPFVKWNFLDHLQHWFKSKVNKLSPPIRFVRLFKLYRIAMLVDACVRVISLADIDVGIARSGVSQTIDVAASCDVPIEAKPREKIKTDSILVILFSVINQSSFTKGFKDFRSNTSKTSRSVS